MPRRAIHKKDKTFRVVPKTEEADELFVTKKITIQKKSVLKAMRFIILQHALSDTEKLLRHLMDANATVHAFIAKPLSKNEAILNKIKTMVPIVDVKYEILEDTPILLNLIQEALALCDEQDQDLVLIDVGGYFSVPLRQLERVSAHRLKGVVEITAFGHEKYEKAVKDIPFPIVSLAKSRTKEFEARFVGEAAASVSESLLRDLGLSMAGKSALVVGYGKIGKSVARALSRRDMKVSVMDRKSFPELQAFRDGYDVSGERSDRIKKADLILSATGAPAISVDDIGKCKSGAFLGSVGSKQTEIDVDGLYSTSIKRDKIHSLVERCQLPDSTMINLLREGMAINFAVDSCPDEIIDLVHAEAVLLAVGLLESPLMYPLNKVHLSNEDASEQVAELWLKRQRG